MEVSNLSDYQLIKEINKSASNEAFLELKKRHNKIFYRTCSSYCSKVQQLRYSEIAEEVDHVLMLAIRSYNPKKKSKFSTWLCNYSRYFCLNSIKAGSELGHFVPTENDSIDLINNQSHRYDLIDNKDQTKKEIFKLLDKVKDSRAKVIFKERFYGDKSSSRWKEIAKKLNLTPQRVIGIYNETKKSLYKSLTKEYNG